VGGGSGARYSAQKKVALPEVKDVTLRLRERTPAGGDKSHSAELPEGGFVAIPFAIPAPYAGTRRKASPVRVADSEAALAETYFESALRVLAECSTVADRAIDAATGLLDSLRTSA
jgi:hypothetical protein